MFRKIFSSLTLLFFIIGSLFPSIEAYASEVQDLQKAIDTAQITIEKIGDTADIKLETIQKTISSKSQKERIDEKQKEIETYVEEVKTSLKENVSNKQELQKVLDDAKKTITLKAVS